MIAGFLALGACGSSGPPAAPPPADVAANFNQPLDARGTEPAWGLKIRGPQLTLNRSGRPDLVVTAAPPSVQDNTATWTAQTPQGQAIKISLYASACTDGVSAARFAFSAEVDLAGESPLIGCGGRPARAP